MTGKELLIRWLNDAYGMENALIQTLEHHIKDARDYPQVQSKLQEHLEQTRNHAQLVEGCVNALGGKTSTIKTGLAHLFGQLQGISTGPAQDELLKDVLNDAAAEHFEVASYTALVQAANALGESQTAQICERILQEDRQMALWLEQNLPYIAQEALQQVAR